MPDLTNFPALDVLIGLVLMFFVLSIVCSAINETIAMFASWRANLLEDGLRRMLGDDHAATVRQRASADGKPAYIDPKLLSRTVLEIVLDAGSAEADGPFQRAKSGAETIQNEAVKKRITYALDVADGSIARFRKELEDEFNAAMDRVSGLYKRKVQKVLIVIALVVAFAANADTFHVANTLWKNPELRSAVAAKANAISQGQRPASGDPATPAECRTTPQQCTQEAIQQIATDVSQVKELGLPLGWGDENSPKWGVVPVLSKAFGLLLTAIALTMGAPFWFDVLGRLSRLRFSGAKPQDSATPASNEPKSGG